MSDFDLEFETVLRTIEKAGKALGQDRWEWREFLRYAAAYFHAFRITRPVVVEIGTLDNAQKPFYETLLGAEHIGIDTGTQSRCRPDILGDSRNPETWRALLDRLAGRPVDLLFIDGNHAYDCAKSDYGMYGPLTRHLVALHDIACFDVPHCVDVLRFWRELCETEFEHLHLSFHKKRTHEVTTIWPGHEMGIGLIVKGGVA